MRRGGGSLSRCAGLDIEKCRRYSGLIQKESPMIQFKPVLLSIFVAAVMMALIAPPEIRAQAGAGKFEGTIFKDDKG